MEHLLIPTHIYSEANRLKTLSCHLNPVSSMALLSMTTVGKR